MSQMFTSRLGCSIISKRPFLSSLSSKLHHASSPVNSFTERTHTCGQLSKDDIGKQVTLFGWVQYSRFDNKIIALRDSYGTVQCIVSGKQLTKSFRRSSIYNESVVKISGIVQARPVGQNNENLSTGEFEIVADEVNIVSPANKDLPILSRDNQNPSSSNRLRHRYLDLRGQSMQHALRFRSEVCRIFRSRLHDLNFVECETPTLYNRTPGGANEFIVPTQTEGMFFSLVQSPQQLKQLLMIGGIDRYYQICRCYRDESTKADRQPEFTQVDIELSFTNQNLVMALVEDLMHNLLSNLSNDQELTNALTSSFDGDLKIPRISYEEAIEKYGTDKPDTRFGWLIENDEQSGLLVRVPHILSDQEMLDILGRAKQQLGPNDVSPEITFEVNELDSMTIVRADNFSELARKLLGFIRCTIAKELDEQGKNVYKDMFKLLWVTDFPLFTIDSQGKLEPNHHPFTAPSQDTAHLLESNPLEVRGQHYDLVFNGQEVAGGSMRIHDADLQRRIFVDILGARENTFAYFLDALKSGCPPHGGIAFGLDRLIAILMQKQSIKDVIAFPKSSAGRDLMTNCPQEIGEDVKRLYHIK